MKQILFLLAAVALLTACSDNQFKVSGTISGASDTTDMVLEMSSNGMWNLVDSVALNDNGKFSVSSEAPMVPTIYRLRVGEETINFPIDSLDHLTVNGRLGAFDNDFDVSGSEHAVQIMEIDKESARLAAANDSAKAAEWKDRLSRQIAADPTSIVAYYAINKYINGQPLYDPLNDQDLKIIGAVANAFYSFRPNDPRTNYLVSVLQEGQRRHRAQSAPQSTIQAQEASLINITLQDYDGKVHNLADVAKNHRLVLLDFTMYAERISPAMNKVLNDIYTARHGQGLEIYQVSLDPNSVTARQAAKNLPWITVYDPNGVNSQNVGNYNVTGLPCTFIISNGEVLKRVEDGSQLQAALAGL